jgi:hypothetical protein
MQRILIRHLELDQIDSTYFDVALAGSGLNSITMPRSGVSPTFFTT